jgi:hypothetical protein
MLCGIEWISRRLARLCRLSTPVTLPPGWPGEQFAPRGRNLFDRDTRSAWMATAASVSQLGQSRCPQTPRTRER